MELFRNPNIDFLGKKWIFIGLSAVLFVAGLIAIYMRGGIPLGVDFKGGTLVYVKFATTPNEDQIRADIDKAGLKNARIQRYGPAANNEVLIALEQSQTSEQALDEGRSRIINALEGNPPAGKQDLNNAGFATVLRALMDKDPLRAGTNAEQRYSEIARSILDYRDKQKSGVLGSMAELNSVAPPEAVKALEAGFFTSNFTVRNVEIVGPQVGQQLRKQALWATLYSLIGMLVYIAFRFEFIYGFAAVTAVFHDTIITVGLFAILNTEISLTVIAALLTNIGYSMNDTIVVFDRVRENVKMLRRERYANIVNTSINQTLSRTALTAGLTFITVVSLLLFGGEVLRGFALALVIGILVGTYSSIFIAAPMVVAYHERGSRGRTAAAASVDAKKEKVKARV